MSEKFKTYRIVSKVAESSIITSFLLKSEAEAVPAFCPGEFLLFELPCGADGSTIRREYSISGVVDDALRVTVKREPAAPGHAPGAGSAYFHDVLSVGDTVRAAGPLGQFKLDRTSDRHAVLISGGVGLTPMAAIARELAPKGKALSFIHACEDGAVHAMGDEMRTLASNCTTMSTHFCYRLPRPEDEPGRDYDSTGLLTQGKMQSLLPLDDYDFYLCGPGAFMQAIYDILLNLGVRHDRIRYEVFGPATVLRQRAAAPDQPVAVPGAGKNGPEAIVHFGKSGISVAWDPAAKNLLEFAEEQGLMPDFSCRSGSCESCKTRLVAGQTDYLFEPFDVPQDGSVLICCSVPKGDITLDL